ncbi:hypothetical protein CFBP2044_40620 [Xanthomonas hortorum pv. cynarae]|nr:hypothetical protein CFBP2044_40620 [Xanthomonas hortorum pv. cynarae]CAD0355769.1 hypothetical protein CFBP2044_40620 [Xanthomonas hortorum pv. cynarae]
MPAWRCGGPCSRHRPRWPLRRSRQVWHGWRCCRTSQQARRLRYRERQQQQLQTLRRQQHRLHRHRHRHRQQYRQQYRLRHHQLRHQRNKRRRPLRQLRLPPQGLKHRQYRPRFRPQSRSLRNRPRLLWRLHQRHRQRCRLPHPRPHQSAAPAWAPIRHAPTPMQRWHAFVVKPRAAACAKTRMPGSVRSG